MHVVRIARGENKKKTYQKLRRVGYQGKERDAEELFVNSEALQDDIDRVHQNFGDDGVQHRGAHQNHGALELAPVGRVVAAVVAAARSADRRISEILMVREGGGTEGRATAPGRRWLRMGSSACAHGRGAPRATHVSSCDRRRRRGNLGDVVDKLVILRLREAGENDCRRRHLGRNLVRRQVAVHRTGDGILA